MKMRDSLDSMGCAKTAGPLAGRGPVDPALFDHLLLEEVAEG